MMPTDILYQFDLAYATEWYSIDISYLSLPLILKVTGTSPSHLYVSGGFEFNFLLESTIVDSLQTRDSLDGIDSFEGAALFGVGGMLALGNNYLFCEGRYSQGLGDIFLKEKKEDLTVSIKTTGLMLMAGFLFRLGGGEP